MLIEFSAENYRSLKERVLLSLIAAPLKARDNETNANNLICINYRLSLLRGAAIYGANASGKTNVLRAFDTMRRIVRRSAAYQEEDTLPVEPFMLARHTQNAASTFEIVFLIDGIQYRYGFTADRQRIHAEWLFVLTSRRESAFFTRDAADTQFLNGIDVNRSRFREGIGTEKKTGANQLFLSKVAADQGETAQKIRDFLVNQCAVINATRDDASLTYTMRCLNENEAGYRKPIIDLVRRLDVDILDISVKEEEIEAQHKRQILSAGRAPKGATDARTVRLFTKHSLRDEQGVPVGEMEFDANEDISEGTIKLIALAGPLVHALETGMVLFVDELDARLHPKMTRALLELFLSPETNPHNAQIVFATHNTNLLDRHLLRRDQIYFCEKDQDATRLYSLADFKLPDPKGGSARVRNDASYETDYIQGRYGAIPYFGDLRGLFREESTSEAVETAT